MGGMRSTVQANVVVWSYRPKSLTSRMKDRRAGMARVGLGGLDVLEDMRRDIEEICHSARI